MKGASLITYCIYLLKQYKESSPSLNYINKNDWEREVTSNQLETVIEEMIMIAEKRNESLDLLLALAARNSRNNHGHYIKVTIKQDDYNRERNQITDGIIKLIKVFGTSWV